jgi:hypothetical protein
MSTLAKLDKYLSRQAKMAVLGYGLLALALFLPLNQVNVATPEGGEMMVDTPYNLKERIASLIFMSIPVIVSVLTINCIAVGSSKGGIPCTVLSWLNALSVFVWCSLVFLLAILLVSKRP